MLTWLRKEEYYKKKDVKKIITIYKMGQESRMFGNIEVEKHKFYQHKNPISIDDINIDRIVGSNMVPFGKKDFKYFTGYKDDSEKTMLLCIMLPKMGPHRRDFDKTTYMSFLMKENEQLEKYNKIWYKFSKIIKKKLIASLYTMKNI